MRGPALFLSLGLWCLPLASRANYVGGPLITVYSSAAIGGDGFTWTGLLDGQGCLHFGANGLLSFDGNAWHVDPAGDSYALRGLALARDGSLFAAATGELGAFTLGRSGAWTYHSFLKKLPPGEREVGELWYAFAGSQHSAAFVGANVVYWWDGNGFQIDRFPSTRRISVCQCGEEIFLHQPGMGLWTVSPGHRRQVIPETRLAGGVAAWVERTARDSLLVATSRGFFVADSLGCRPVFPAASAFLHQNGLTCVSRLHDRTIAVGTLRGGLALLDANGSIRRVCDRRSGLPTDEVFSLVEDGEGGLWASSSANIVRLATATRTTVYHENAGIGDQTVVAVETGSHGVYVVDDEGAIARTSGNLGPDLDAFGTVSRHVYCGAVVHQQLYVGAASGIFRIAEAGPEPVFRVPHPVFALTATYDRDSLLAAVSRTLRLVDPSTGRSSILAGSLDDDPTSLAQTTDGAVWLGMTRRGIQRFDAGKGPSPSSVFGLPTSGHGEVAQSAGNCLYGFDGGHAWGIESGGNSRGPLLESIEGFPGREVAAAEGRADRDGAWVIASSNDDCGPCLLEIRGRECRPWLVEGLWQIGVPELVHVCPTASGWEVWVAGSSGILRTKLDGKWKAAVLPTPTLELAPAGPDGFAVSGSFRSYALRPALQLQLKIQEVDREWTTAMPGTVRRLASLQAGDYRVQARVLSAVGIPGPETVTHWTIRRRWWLRLPAISAESSLAAILGWWSMRIRMRSFQQRAATLELRIRERTAELERVTAEKTRLVAGISHDIRNPLNGIVGLVLTLEETSLGPEQRKILDAMGACARHLSGMLQDVIDFAKLETGRAELIDEPYSPAAVLEEVVALLFHDAERCGAQLAASCDPNLNSMVCGDSRRIRQILLNLAHNAVKYAGGTIRLSARCLDAQTLEFVVEDRGPGIVERERESIFEPFVRAGNSRGRDGSGLGLATARRWAELMGGSVRLVTRVGEGCSFRLSLPLRPIPEVCLPDLPPVNRVLLVEDEEYSARATTAVAARLGITVTARATAGRECLQLWDEAPFELVLLDRQLPDMDGTTVCRELRARKVAAPALIIAVTAAGDAASERACLDAGMDWVLLKPVSPKTMREALVQANRFRMLRFLGGGSVEGFRSEVGRYMAILGDLDAAVRAAARGGDAETIRQSAHRLAGHFRMVDCGEGIAAIAQLEQETTRGNPDLAPALERMAHASARLVSQLQKVAGLPGAPGGSHFAEHTA